MTELEKLDVLRERLGFTYEEAKAALAATEGDLVQALIDEEKKQEKCKTTAADWKEKVRPQAENIMEQIKQVIKEGNATKVRLMRNDEVIAELPLTFGVIGIAGMLFSLPLTIIGLLGTATAVAAKWKLVIIKNDNSVEERDLGVDFEDVDYAAVAYDDLVQTGSNVEDLK
ncbi:MAG: DUF4342 domain-containing protein [Clostridia bacterium]